MTARDIKSLGLVPTVMSQINRSRPQITQVLRHWRLQ